METTANSAGNDKSRCINGIQRLLSLVRRAGLEPARCYPLAPQASASANSATSAWVTLTNSYVSYFLGVAGVGAPGPGAGWFSGLPFWSVTFTEGPLVWGAACVGTVFLYLSSTLPPVTAAPWRLDMIASVSAVIMNKPAAIVVAFERMVFAPRGPKTVCDPIPPNAPARSAALPLWSSTTIIRKRQITTWMVVTR